VAPNFVEHEAVPGLPPTREGLKQKYTLLRAGFPEGDSALFDRY
jgi:hypothetical protein